ncbi:MAG: GNAT family N-acetyltransferase [Candidatus Bathyarchaeia archaeon]|mgnify:CR=1 FL=1
MLKIRVAEQNDLPKIIELIKRNKEPLNEDLGLFSILKAQTRSADSLLQKRMAKLLFWESAFYRWNRSAYVINLLVDAGYRRRGIGSLLRKTMDEFARENGARVLMFDTAIDNIPALNLYFKNDFKICGYNEKLYDIAKTALYLAKEL